MRRGVTLGLVLLALALRAPGLFTDFWLDEIWALGNVGAIDSPVGVFTAIHHDSNHYLISLWMYGVGQDAAFWVYRLPSLVAGVAAVLLAGRLAEAEQSSPRLAMLLVATSFPLGFYATEARGYAVAAAAALASLLCLLRWLDGGRPTWLLMTWASSAIGLLAHLSFVAVLAAQAVFLGALAVVGRLPVPRALLPLSVPLVALVGLAIVDLGHLELGGGPPLDVLALLESLGALAIGVPLGYGWTAWMALAGGAGIVLLLGLRLEDAVRDAHPAGPHRLAWVFYAAVVVLPLAAALSLQPPFLFPRYFLVSLAFVPLLVANGLARLAVPLGRAAIVLLIVLHGWSWMAFWRDGRGHYREALVSILAAAPEGIVTVGGDHEFRTPLILDFYAGRLGPDGARLSHVPSGADFTIVSHPATPVTPELCGACILVGDYPSSVLSGSRWRIYRRSP